VCVCDVWLTAETNQNGADDDVDADEADDTTRFDFHHTVTVVKLQLV